MTYLVPAAVAVVMALGAKRKEGNLLAPGPFMVGFWCVLILLHAVAGFDVRVWSGAVWWILSIAAFVWLGDAVASLHVRPRPPARVPVEKWIIPTSLVVAGGTLAGLAGAVVLIYSANRTLAVFLHMDDFARMAADYATMRYRGYSEPLGFRVIMIPHYVATLFAGMLFALAGRGWKLRLLAMGPFASAVLFTAILTTKASTLVTALMWFSTFLATKGLVSGGRFALLTRRRLIIGGVALAVILPMFLVVSMARYEATSWSQAGGIVERLRLDFFGYLGPISVWWYSYLNDPTPPLTLGALSFAGPMDLLGLTARRTGVYSESVYLSYGRASNIYTAFRGIVQDFGLVGSTFGWFFTGLGAGWAYRRLVQGAVFPLVFVAAFYFFVLWSHVAFVFMYNSTILAWALFGLFLLWAGWRARRGVAS